MPSDFPLVSNDVCVYVHKGKSSRVGFIRQVGHSKPKVSLKTESNMSATNSPLCVHFLTTHIY